MADTIVFSGDGKQMATACADGRARVWNVSDPLTPVAELHAQHGECNSVAFNSDASMLATTGDDGAIKIWQLPEGTLVRRMDGVHDGMGFQVLFTPDDEMVVSCGNDPQVKVWSVTSGHLLHDWENHPGATSEAIAISPDGSRVASVDTHRHLVLRRFDEPEAIEQVELDPLHAGSDAGKLRAVKFLADGDVIAVATESGMVSVHDGDRLAHIASEVFSTDGFRGLATDGGNVAVAVDYAGNLHRIDLSDAARLDRLGPPQAAHEGRIWSIACCPSEQLIATSGKDATVRVFPLDSESEAAWTLPVEQTTHWSLLDDTQLWVAGERGTVQKVSLSSGEIEVQKEFETEIKGIDVHPDGKIVAISALMKSKLFILDSNDLRILHAIPANTPENIRFSSDGRYLAFTNKDADRLVILNVADWSENLTVDGVNPYGLASSPNAPLFAGKKNDELVLVNVLLC